MNNDREHRLSDREAWAFLERLMPTGYAGPDVLSELASDGWENCGLVRAFHPTLEQCHKEMLVIHKNFQLLRNQRNDEQTTDEPPTLEDSRKAFQESAIEPEEECREIVGRVLWEIFSENNTVISSDGREVDLGSWRGTGSTLSDFDFSSQNKLEQKEEDPSGSDEFSYDGWGDYLRFYMGLAFISGRADYRPVYEMIFSRLKNMGADWIYEFPRLHILRFHRPEEETDDPSDYSPSEAFAREQQKRAEDEEFFQMKDELDESNKKAAETASKAEPPPIVQAYQRIFGRFPIGWPPA